MGAQHIHLLFRCRTYLPGDYLLVGIIGAPNKGKSTLFSALTLNMVEIADYPFTTIKPNSGVAYARKECPEVELGTKCNPRNAPCDNGTRMLPVNVIDVAGLVRDAHSGKGMGNQFLNDLAAADAFIIVVDGSGMTDSNGNPGEGNPVDDVDMVINELTMWLTDIIGRHMPALSKAKDGVEALKGVLTGLKVSGEQIADAIGKSHLTSSNIGWSAADIEKFASELLHIAKPFIIASNKTDAAKDKAKTGALEAKFGADRIVRTSAEMELALRKASKAGLASYVPGARDFSISESASGEQRKALEYMRSYVSHGGTGVQELIDRVVFGLLDNVVAYPVEDENKYSDHFGNVLPDAYLMKKGSTALDLAGRIHTDIAKSMLYAIDAKRKMRLAKDYELKGNDVIKIVSAAR